MKNHAVISYLVFLLTLFSSCGDNQNSEWPTTRDKLPRWITSHIDEKEGLFPAWLNEYTRVKRTKPLISNIYEAWLLSMDKCDDPVCPMPDEGCVRLKINYPGGNLKELFRDSNSWHYKTGEAIGITPLDSFSTPTQSFSEQFTNYITGNTSLLPIESNRYFIVDNLTHSHPYLVGEAYSLLHEIGKKFHDTLQARGGGNYRLKVTSVLRTRNSVSRLRRINRASVDSSAHLFGTTFDISFTNFAFGGDKPQEPHRTQEDLKNLLAEILYDLRAHNRCFIIYEHKHGCFHITARPYNS